MQKPNWQMKSFEIRQQQTNTNKNFFIQSGHWIMPNAGSSERVAALPEGIKRGVIILESNWELVKLGLPN